MDNTHIIPYKARIPEEKARPLIEVYLKNVGMVICLLDSGADITTMPLSFGNAAGVEPKKYGIKGHSECAHGHRSVSYTRTTRVTIFDEEMDLPINFVKDGGDPALLGREGFFDKFEITFNDASKEVILKRKSG